MNELEAIETILEDKELAELMELVERARKNNSQTFAGNFLEVGRTIKGLGLMGFLGMEFIRFTEASRSGGTDDFSQVVYTLLPAAYHRYNYENKRWLGKKIKTIVLKWNNGLTIIAFVISMLLFILRVLEMAGLKLIIDY